MFMAARLVVRFGDAGLLYTMYAILYVIDFWVLKPCRLFY